MKIKDYKDFGVLDFVEDQDFRSWVMSQDTSLDMFWSAYLKNYPHQKQILEEARFLIEEMHNYFHLDVQEITIPEMNVFEKVPIDSKYRPSKVQAKPPRKMTMIYSIATACCIIMLFGVGFLLFNNNSELPSELHYVTGHAEWKEVTLPDGSRVELNANTQLSLTDEWQEGGDRNVWLKGEAFFKVKKIPATNSKFTVTTKDLEVDVLGTTFNVNTRNDHTEVFLEEGQIILDMQGKVEQIEPGEFISFSGKTKKILDRYQKTEEIHSNWKDGVLKITNAKMEDILSEVESIYGIDLIVKDKSLLQREGSVAIPVDDLDMAASILERVLNVKMSRKGKQIFID